MEESGIAAGNSGTGVLKWIGAEWSELLEWRGVDWGEKQTGV